MKTPPPKKSLGQHFLTDKRLLHRIVSAAGVLTGERVLEIGPGPGGLTHALLEAGAEVWAVEADLRMVELLRDQQMEGLHLLHGDALEVDYPRLSAEAGGRFRLVANLPYNISGPLLAHLLRQRRAFTSLSIMVQREVGERILAQPGTRARGRLGVMAQCFCTPRALLKVPPGAFRPPPKVDSMVVRLDVYPELPYPLDDEEQLWTVVREAFGQRRKMLRKSLRGPVAHLDAVLSRADLRGTERPEELTVPQWMALANAIRAQRPAD